MGAVEVHTRPCRATVQSHYSFIPMSPSIGETMPELAPRICCSGPEFTETSGASTGGRVLLDPDGNHAGLDHGLHTFLPRRRGMRKDWPGICCSGPEFSETSGASSGGRVLLDPDGSHAVLDHGLHTLLPRRRGMRKADCRHRTFQSINADLGD